MLSSIPVSPFLVIPCGFNQRGLYLVFYAIKYHKFGNIN